jgi:hypothetical protein
MAEESLLQVKKTQRKQVGKANSISWNRFDVCDDGFSGDDLVRGKVFEYAIAKSMLLRNRLLPPHLKYHWYRYKGQSDRPGLPPPFAALYASFSYGVPFRLRGIVSAQRDQHLPV